MAQEKLNKVAFYSLRVVAVIYLMLVVMMILMSFSAGDEFFVGVLAAGLVSGLMYLFYRASEEAKAGSNLGRILTGLCGLLLLVAFIIGAGNGMKWLGLVLGLYWIYKFFDWEYAEE